MQISLEKADAFSVQSYSDTDVKIHNQFYQHSLLVSQQGVLDNWPVQLLQDLNQEILEPALQQKPTIILIGHTQGVQLPPYPLVEALSKQRIAIECMSIGAACRTYNVLLSENRDVVLGLILPTLTT